MQKKKISLKKRKGGTFKRTSKSRSPDKQYLDENGKYSRDIEMEKRRQGIQRQNDTLCNNVRRFLLEPELPIMKKWEVVRILYTKKEIAEKLDIAAFTVNVNFIQNGLLRAKYWPGINDLFLEIVQDYAPIIGTDRNLLPPRDLQGWNHRQKAKKVASRLAAS